LDRHCCKLSFSIIVVIFITVDEINFSEIVASANLIIDFTIILFVKDIANLSSCEEKDFINRISLFVNESLFFNFDRSEKGHKECNKVRRFVLQKFNLVNDIFMHYNRKFYFQLSRKIINEVCMLIIFFRVVIVKSKSQSTIKVIGYLVLLSDVIECIHFLLQLASFDIQT